MSCSRDAEDDADDSHRDDRGATNEIISHRWLATLDEIDRADDEDDGGEDVRQIGEVAKKVEHRETMLHMNDELCADRHQRQQPEEQPSADENVPFAHDILLSSQSL